MILSSNGKYEITEKNGRWLCTCPDYKYRHAATLAGECKHIKEVKDAGTVPITGLYKPRIFFERTAELLREMLSDKTFEICGSYRRQAAKLKDLDVVVCIKDIEDLQDRIKHVGYIQSGGEKKIVADINKVQVDFRILENLDHWGSMLMHCTGSKEENIRLRQKAKTLGLKLNEYSFPHLTEREIYEKLGEEYKEPCER